MEAIDREFHFVASSVERAISRHAAAAREFLSYETRRGAAVCHHLVALFEAFERHVAKRRAEYAEMDDGAVKRGALVEMRKLLRSARKFQHALAWIDAAHNPPLDLGSTYFVEHAARALVTVDAEVVVVASTEFSYSTTSNPYRALTMLWGGSSDRRDDVILVLVPRREQYTGLLHPLIVHELGHALDYEHRAVRGIVETGARRVPIDLRFGRATRRIAEAAQVEGPIAARYLSNRLLKWVAEIFCDAIATEFLGPSYLYAFLAEVGAGDLDTPGTAHPPPRQRVRLMVDHLDRLGWGETMASGAPELDAWIRETAATKRDYGQEERFLLWALNQLAALVRRTAAARVKPHRFRPDSIQLATVRRFLEQNVPPAQFDDRTAVPRAAIILGTWLYALESVGGGIVDLGEAPHSPILAELLPKSLEMSAVVEAWA
jgi:hypothetical protein